MGARWDISSPKETIWTIRWLAIDRDSGMDENPPASIGNQILANKTLPMQCLGFHGGDMLDPNLERIPSEVKVQPQWVVWRQEVKDGRLTKVPYQPRSPKGWPAALPPDTGEPLTWPGRWPKGVCYEPRGNQNHHLTRSARLASPRSAPAILRAGAVPAGGRGVGPEVFPAIIDAGVKAESFYREDHGRIYRAMFDLYSRGENRLTW